MLGNDSAWERTDVWNAARPASRSFDLESASSVKLPRRLTIPGIIAANLIVLKVRVLEWEKVGT